LSDEILETDTSLQQRMFASWRTDHAPARLSGILTRLTRPGQETHRCGYPPRFDLTRRIAT